MYKPLAARLLASCADGLFSKTCTYITSAACMLFNRNSSDKKKEWLISGRAPLTVVANEAMQLP